MDMTPGGRDESRVPENERLNEEVELEKRVELLIETTCFVGERKGRLLLHSILNTASQVQCHFVSWFPFFHPTHTLALDYG